LNATPAHRLKGTLHIDAETRFPVSDGSTICFARGSLACEYGFAAAAQRAERELEDRILGWLEVCDAAGSVYRAETLVRGNWLLELVRLGRPWRESPENSEILSGIRCCHDRRSYIPAFSRTEEGGPRAIAYFTEGLEARVDLLGHPGGLVVRVHPVRGGGIGAEDTPEVIVRTLWGPRLILWPSLIHDAIDPTVPPAIFERTGRHGDPQTLVRVRL
jgi:hypothetical protein